MLALFVQSVSIYTHLMYKAELPLYHHLVFGYEWMAVTYVTNGKRESFEIDDMVRESVAK